MKKFLLTIMAALMLLVPLSSVAEPFVTLSLLTPGAYILTGDFDSDFDIDLDKGLNPDDFKLQYDVADVVNGEGALLVIPQEVHNAGISLESLLGGKTFSSFLADIFKTAVLAVSITDTDVIDASGTITVTPGLSTENDSLTGYITLDYDDIKAFYLFGSKTTLMSIDGTITLAAELLGDPLFSISVSTGDMSVSGDTSYSNQEVEIRFDLRYDIINAYLALKGVTLDDQRAMVASMILSSQDVIDAVNSVGYDISEISSDDLISALEEMRAIDIVDALILLQNVGDDDRFSDLEKITMGISASLYLNGERADLDVDEVVSAFGTLITAMDNYS